MSKAKVIQKKKEKKSQSSESSKEEDKTTGESREIIDMDTSVVNKYGDLFVSLRKEIGIRKEKETQGDRVLEFDTQERKSFFKIPDLSELYSDIVESKSLDLQFEVPAESFVQESELKSLNLGELKSLEEFVENLKLKESSKELQDINSEVEIFQEKGGIVSESLSTRIRNFYPEREIKIKKEREHRSSLDMEYYIEERAESEYNLPGDTRDPNIVSFYQEASGNKNFPNVSREAYELGKDLKGLETARPLEQGVEFSYSKQENETETSRRYVLEIDEAIKEQLKEGATVKDALLYLNNKGLQITIAEQPFYSPDPFDNGGDPEEEGWKDSYFMVQSVNGYSTKNMEILTGDEEELNLAGDSIENIQIDAGDYIAIDFSEDYGSCGKVKEETREEIKQQYMEQYGVWIEDDWERGIYTSLAKNADFYGSPLDISEAPEAREAYIKNFGVAPEEVFDNVEQENQEEINNLGSGLISLN